MGENITKTFVLLGAAIGAACFTATSALAVPGILTVSATALTQNTNNAGYETVKKYSLNQKVILTVLAQATGDSSITNKKTTVLYDPDAFNANAFNSSLEYPFYGIFYYSNAVSGLQELDGIDTNDDYYSYMEFDFTNALSGNVEGFWNINAGEFNNALTTSKNSEEATGNGILYIHSNPYDFDLPASEYFPGQYFLANLSEGTNQDYAFVMHGLIKYSGTVSGETLKESGKITGSGDGLYEGSPLVISGEASFTGKGPSD